MRKKMAFIVDDDKMMQHFLEYSFIGREDYTIKTFSDPEDCLSDLNSNPDIIILDHTFVGKNKEMLNGLETLKRIRIISPSLPVTNINP
ncbi:MAG: response regulator, partial [Bacteroidales bacterium]|nr:response regulator [Bacteroidales bacterium]